MMDPVYKTNRRGLDGMIEEIDGLQSLLQAIERNAALDAADVRSMGYYLSALNELHEDLVTDLDDQVDDDGGMMTCDRCQKYEYVSQLRISPDEDDQRTVCPECLKAIGNA